MFQNEEFFTCLKYKKFNLQSAQTFCFSNKDIVFNRYTCLVKKTTQIISERLFSCAPKNFPVINNIPLFHIDLQKKTAWPAAADFSPKSISIF